MAELITSYRSRVPAGESGAWEVHKFEVSEKEARLATFMYGPRTPGPGTYTRLVHHYRGTIMSDTPAELLDLYEPYYRANGSCLIHGLGLGIVLELCLQKLKVDHVTVIEIDPDVIRLVQPYFEEHYPADSFTIICADAFEWKPTKGVRYDMVWHDIWDGICADNLHEMATLSRRYGRRTNWQGAWCKEECLDVRRQER